MAGCWDKACVAFFRNELQLLADDDDSNKHKMNSAEFSYLHTQQLTKQKAINGDEVVICNKLPGSKVWNFPLGFGLRCYENCRDMEPNPQGYWLADRAIGYPWSYVNNKKYKYGADYHLKSLIDMVSRGGIFFLSLTPKGDGSIPDEEKEIMKEMGAWLSIHGEAIYSTRRWKHAAEGPAVMLRTTKTGKHKWDFTNMTGKDTRYTRSKDNTKLYATVLGIPEGNKIILKLLAKGKKIATGKIKSIQLYTIYYLKRFLLN